MNLYSIPQKIKEHILRRTQTPNKVFVFHQVNNNTNEWEDNNCSISLKSFVDFIDSLERRGFKSCPLMDMCNEGLVPSFPLYNITFDDAYSDVFTQCYPILKKRGIHFTVFIALGYLNKTNYLDEAMIKEMIGSGLCTIGSHTFSHSLLRKLNVLDLENEIVGSKNKLESLFKTKIDCFAYPYGSLMACSKKSVEVVAKSTYLFAFSTMRANIPCNISANRFFLPRINVNEANWEKSISL